MTAAEMSRFTELPKPVLLALATVFAVVVTAYTALWLYYNDRPPGAQLGINFDDRHSAVVLRGVVEGSPAERAGLKTGDKIVEVNGRTLESLYPFNSAILRGQAGDVMELRVIRQGQAEPLKLRATLRAWVNLEADPGLPRRIAEFISSSYPVWFLSVGLYILFLRIRDPNAWWLAACMACFIAGPGLPGKYAAVWPPLRPFMLTYQAVMLGMLGPVLFCFFSVFPARAWMDQRWPRLKTIFLWIGMLFLVPALLFDHELLPAGLMAKLRQWPASTKLLLTAVGLLFAMCLVGIFNLVWTSLKTEDRDLRRKTRIIVWGGAVGCAPMLLLEAAITFGGQEPVFWVELPAVLLLICFPVSIAYAVMKHRVLEIPALLRRGTRYFLVKGGLRAALILLCIFVPWQLAQGAVSALGLDQQVSLPLAVLFGSGLTLLATQSAHGLEEEIAPRIDRAFFRGVYDTRQLLVELADKTRSVSNRAELAGLLHKQIAEALHPASLQVYLAGAGGDLEIVGALPPAALQAARLSPQMPILTELMRLARPWDVPPLNMATRVALGELASLHPDVLVPLMAREGHLTGLVVLGFSLSEEPYSAEDLRLLASVASQAGMALENIRLAEDMAARLQTERKQASEMAIAKEVQAKLFPQRTPALATLEYVGSCQQARTVGGDYYDYLDFGPGRIGLVLADISGKGIFAALLMANLQAYLRSQSVIHAQDPGELLRSVNKLFFESVTPGLYATLFFYEYDDATRRIRYVNCGHNPALLLRRDGSSEKLEATATVLGLVEEWEAEVKGVALGHGDTLVVYSDGVTDAATDAGEMFGTERLLETIRRYHELPVPALTKAIGDTVQKFSGHEQEDDLTLLVARGR